MFKSKALVAASALSLTALAACAPPHHHFRQMRAISVLTCPEEEGDLKRTAQAADGKSCDYSGPNGAVVNLKLVALNGGTADAALNPFSDALTKDIPTSATDQHGGADSGKVDIDLPGIHIHANGNDHDHGDHGNVTINGGGVGGVNVDAHDNGATVQVHEDDRGIRRMVLRTTEKPGPNGWKVAAFDARGPVGGPLAVAIIHSKGDMDDIESDVRDLLKENVGGGNRW